MNISRSRFWTVKVLDKILRRAVARIGDVILCVVKESRRPVCATIRAGTVRVEISLAIARVVERQAVEKHHVMKGNDDNPPRDNVQR